MFAEQVGQKDVVLAVLGASAALAGLGLVFLGLVVATYQSYQPREREDIKGSYQWFGSVIFIAFLMGLLSVDASTGWLILQPDKHWLYVAAVASFATEGVLLALATVGVTYKVLWTG